jgi:signal transduction histidine kinase
MAMLARGPRPRALDDPLYVPRSPLSADEETARSEARRIVRRALVSYAVASVGALLFVGLGASAVAETVARDGAVHDAGFYTQKFAQLTVAPLVTQDLADGDPQAIARLDEIVKRQMAEHEVLRVKVWSADARVLYSDEPRLIGRTFDIEPDDREVLETLGLDAHVSPSTKRENEFEAAFGETLEVYAGVRAADGDPVLVEAYLPVDRLDALRESLRSKITPLVVLSLLALELLLLPLAVVLARRIARGHEERATLSRLASHAAESERHSIAAELHDGVIQDLVAVGFGLGTVRAVADREGQADIGAAAQQLNDIVREDVRVLRGLIGSLAVGDLAATPLAGVVTQAALEAEQSGLVVERHVADVEPHSRDVHTALSLVAREAVRNAVRHANATRLVVRLARDEDRIVLEVTDDGCGFDPAETSTVADGHLGLTLYARAARAAGGGYTLRTTPGGGTSLVVRVPADGVPKRPWWRRGRTA